jgi:hypothetical protein
MPRTFIEINIFVVTGALQQYTAVSGNYYMRQIISIIIFIQFGILANCQTTYNYIKDLKDSTLKIETDPFMTLINKNGWYNTCFYCVSWDTISYFNLTPKETQTYYFKLPDTFLIIGNYDNRQYKIHGTYKLKNDSLLIRYNGNDINPSNDTIHDYKILKLNKDRMIVEFTYDKYKDPNLKTMTWKICPKIRTLFIKKE